MTKRAFRKGSQKKIYKNDLAARWAFHSIDDSDKLFDCMGKSYIIELPAAHFLFHFNRSRNKMEAVAKKDASAKGKLQQKRKSEFFLNSLKNRAGIVYDRISKNFMISKEGMKN